ncbi:MAG TPA: alpha/beta hydrolase [Victivallales bacterium]|nr:alpha/beta hydrolase [Victivallales bacterium]
MDYKYININGLSTAYTDRGEGQPILLVHSFGSFSITWQKLVKFLPVEFRVITLDLKGHGYSEKKCDYRLSPSDQSMILSKFIERLGIEKIVLIGHAFGGAVCLFSLFDEYIKKKVSNLILINSSGLSKTVPAFIEAVSKAKLDSSLFKIISEEVIVEQVMKNAFFDFNKFDKNSIKHYGNVLRMEGAKKCLIAAARQIKIKNYQSFIENIKSIDIPSLVIWGNNDHLIDFESALTLKDLLHADLRVINSCGHLPHEEAPLKTASYICDFLEAPVRLNNIISETNQPDINGQTKKNIIENEQHLTPINKFVNKPVYYMNKVKMTRLIDKWTFGSFLIIIFIKTLQVLKAAGLKTEENGWRKTTSIFLRKEHSKFVLASFRLKYYRTDEIPANLTIAKNILIEQLRKFLIKTPECHWALEWSHFRAVRKQVYFTDIMEVEFDKKGKLIRLVPYFDKSRETFTRLKTEIINEIIRKFINTYNEYITINDARRPWIIYKKLRNWIRYKFGISHSGKHELRHLLDRILNSTFIQFDTFSEKYENMSVARLATPNMNKSKHPGFGLLNIACRFTHSYDEADLWFQYHHVPVDGMTMQEMLQALKEEWGSVGKVLYPALSSNAAKPEIFYCGKNIFRGRIYANFEKFIKIRKYLNKNYYAEMAGPATFLSMLAWGVSHTEYFNDCKFTIPFNVSEVMNYTNHERSLSLIFIRPGNFFDRRNKLAGFLAYQREFNRRLFSTKLGKSESHELLELYALAHPIFFYFARYLMPKAMGDVVGTAGMTMLKDAEMFVSPLTDIQQKGFIAFGNLKTSTEDGSTAGAVSFCGSKLHVKEYMKAVDNLSKNYDKFLDLEI